MTESINNFCTSRSSLCRTSHQPAAYHTGCTAVARPTGSQQRLVKNAKTAIEIMALKRRTLIKCWEAGGRKMLHASKLHTKPNQSDLFRGSIYRRISVKVSNFWNKATKDFVAHRFFDPRGKFCSHLGQHNNKSGDTVRKFSGIRFSR